MQINYFHKLTNLLAAAALFYYAIPLLMGQQEQSFEQYEGILGIVAHTSRIVVGISEIIAAALLLIVTFMEKSLMAKFVYLFLSVTMVGALLLEFFLRSSPEWRVVVLAVLLILLSVYRIKRAV